MLLVISALKGFTIEALDGPLGTAEDFLFDDAAWRVRWLVVGTGGWLSHRQVLVHPSAIGVADIDRSQLPVNLTKKQVEESPEVLQGEVLTQATEDRLFRYYGWDSAGWYAEPYEPPLGAMATPFSSPPYLGFNALIGSDIIISDGDVADPTKRSVDDVTGFHVHASDGPIGHVENFIVDSDTWRIQYLIVATRNWWPGQHVLIAPEAVVAIKSLDRVVEIDVTRKQVKASPPWDPLALMKQADFRSLRAHYGWPMTNY